MKRSKTAAGALWTTGVVTALLRATGRRLQSALHRFVGGADRAIPQQLLRQLDVAQDRAIRGIPDLHLPTPVVRIPQGHGQLRFAIATPRSCVNDPRGDPGGAGQAAATARGTSAADVQCRRAVTGTNGTGNDTAHRSTERQGDANADRQTGSTPPVRIRLRQDLRHPVEGSSLGPGPL